MSREVMRFCAKGYITRVDKIDWQVYVNDADSITSHIKIGRNSSSLKLGTAVLKMGGYVTPDTARGWEVIYRPGQMNEHPNEYILRDMNYGGKYWRAYWTGGWKNGLPDSDNAGFGWKAKNIGSESDMNEYVGEGIYYETPYYLPPDATETPSNTDLSFLKDNRTEITAAVIVAAIVLTVIIWKT